jgi:hypothetical protein
MFEIRSFAELALFLTSRDIILAGEMKMRKTIVAILTVLIFLLWAISTPPAEPARRASEKILFQQMIRPSL